MDKDKAIRELPSIDVLEIVPDKLEELLITGPFDILERTLESACYCRISDRMPKEEFDRYLNPIKTVLPNNWFDCLRQALNIRQKRLEDILSVGPDRYGEMVVGRAAVLALRKGVLHQYLYDNR